MQLNATWKPRLPIAPSTSIGEDSIASLISSRKVAPAGRMKWMRDRMNASAQGGGGNFLGMLQAPSGGLRVPLLTQERMPADLSLPKDC